MEYIWWKKISNQLVDTEKNPVEKENHFQIESNQHPIKNKCTLHPTQLGFNVLVLNVVVGEKFHQIWHLKIIKIGCVTWHRRTKKKSLVKQDKNRGVTFMKFL